VPIPILGLATLACLLLAAGSWFHKTHTFSKVSALVCSLTNVFSY